MNKITRAWNNLTGRYGDYHHPVPRWRRSVVSVVAFLVGVQVKIDALPYGASYERHLRVKGTNIDQECDLPRSEPEAV